MANDNFGAIQQRFNDLIGETSSTTASDVGKRHINAVVQDIIGSYSFSWNTKTTTISLVSGVATLPADFYVGWGIEDARVGTDNSLVFTYVPIADRDSFSSSNPIFWITYDTTTDTYIFNSNAENNTITIIYHFIPADMVNLTDKCLIIDPETVAYGAAAKNWVSDERNVELKREYEATYTNGVKSLYLQDLQNGAGYSVDGVASFQNWTF